MISELDETVMIDVNAILMIRLYTMLLRINSFPVMFLLNVIVLTLSLKTEIHKRIGNDIWN